MTITAEGYQDLRERVAAAWTYIGFRAGETEHFRLSVSDPRVSVVEDGTENPVTVEALLAGDDPEIAGQLPLVVDNTALYKVAEGGDIMDSDSFIAFTFELAGDLCTFRHTIQGPPIG
jgi:hypothetical protein